MWEISGKTSVTGVVGRPVAHSLSPVLHNSAYRALGLDWVSVAFEVFAGEGVNVVSAMKTLGLKGLSVTTPHKDAAARNADEASDAVKALGAANCLVRLGGGKVRAENTDGDGFLASLKHDSGSGVEGKIVAILGAGGAARAIARSCALGGAREVLIVNRTLERAEFCASLAGDVGFVGAPQDISRAQIVVNATTLGMGASQEMPCDPTLLRVGQVVVDIIYDPVETVWLKASRAAGIRAFNGTSILVFQAAQAITHWTGQPAPMEEMLSAVERELN